MKDIDKQTEFVVFCIENTAIRTGLSGKDIYTELKRTDGIKSFIYPSYNALHTQSKEYIVDETINYLKTKNNLFLNTK